MDDRQRRKYNAAVGGQEVLTNHSSVYAGNTPLENKVTAHLVSINKIEDLQAAQELDRTGGTVAKATAKSVMATQAWVIAKLVTEYAKDIADTVLEEEIDFEKSDLLFRDDALSKLRCKLVRDRADTHQAAMAAAGYQLTAGMVTDLSSAITDFENREGDPEEAKGEATTATGDLAGEFKKLSTIEESIENLLVTYALSNASFYGEVLDAFEVNDSGNRKRALRVAVLDDATGVRLRNANVSIVELPDLARKSSKRGIADFDQMVLPEGNYTLQISLTNYTSVTVANVAIITNKHLRMEIRLVKI